MWQLRRLNLESLKALDLIADVGMVVTSNSIGEESVGSLPTYQTFRQPWRASAILLNLLLSVKRIVGFALLLHERGRLVPRLNERPRCLLTVPAMRISGYSPG
jgi:hypothetical protein